MKKILLIFISILLILTGCSKTPDFNKESSFYYNFKGYDIKNFQQYASFDEDVEFNENHTGILIISETQIDIPEDLAQCIKYYNGVLSILTGGIYVLKGVSLENSIKIDILTEENVKLVIDNLKINSNSGPLINSAASVLEIFVVDNTENEIKLSINDKSESLIKAEGKVIFNGSGKLELYSRQKHAVEAEQVIIAGGNLIIDSDKNGISCGSLFFYGGNLEIKSLNNAVKAKYNINIYGGLMNINANNKGISADNNITVDNGYVVLNNAIEGITSSDIVINNGYFFINSSDDCINAQNQFVINNGMVSLNSRAGDAIDSNGTLIINGGIIIAAGAASPECGLDSNDNPLIINGGFVIATGGSTSLPSSDSLQNILILKDAKKSLKNINLKIGEIDILNYYSSVNFETLVFSSPDLLSNVEIIVNNAGYMDSETEFFGVKFGLINDNVSQYGKIKINSNIENIIIQ